MVAPASPAVSNCFEWSEAAAAVHYGSPMSSIAGFRHEARFYAGAEGFLAATVPFVREGLAAGDHVLVVVPRHKIAWLHDSLDGDAASVRFADMGQVGENPARIIPAWQRFVDDHAADGRGLRGIGEPIGPHLGGAEVVESHRHEGLLNVAFESGRPWRLLCPYDTESLAPAVVAEARRTHPFIDDRVSGAYDDSFATAPFAAPLPEPPGHPVGLVFDNETIRSVRRVVSVAAQAAGVAPSRVTDLALSAHELATNSVRYGGGTGTVRSWTEGDTFVVEVRDAGYIDDPLVGRVAPASKQPGGRGVWLCNQLCDLVQIDSTADGTAIRLPARIRYRSS